MSKIGRKSIDIGAVQVEIKGQEIHYKGKKNSGVHILPPNLTARLEGNKLFIEAKSDSEDRDVNRVWGLHRALLANALKGADTGFEKQIQINGLGFKGILTGNKIVFSLGYSHKIDFDIPKEISVEIDKTGQLITLKSFDKEMLGHICSSIKALRPPEPYKGTGIKLSTEVIARKAGKTKAG